MQFHKKLTEWEFTYVVGVQSAVTVWRPGEQPKRAPKRKPLGRPPKLCGATRNINPSA